MFEIKKLKEFCVAFERNNSSNFEGDTFPSFSFYSDVAA